MRNVNRDNLYRWLSCWKRELREPGELFLGLGLFVNVVQAALGELERRYRLDNDRIVKRTQVNWERRVLGLLESAFDRDAPTLGLLRVEHGDLVDELEDLLREESYDVGRIYPILKRIEDSPSIAVIEDAIVDELLGEGDRTHLTVFVRLLARRAISNWRLGALEDLPKKTFARSYVLLLVEACHEDLAGDPDINAATRATWREFLSRTATSPRVTETVDSDSASLFDVFQDDDVWRSLSYNILEDLREAWTTILLDRASEREDSEVGSLGTPDHTVHRVLGQEAARAYARAFSRRALSVANQIYDGEVPEVVEGLGHRLQQRLVSAGVIAEVVDWQEEHYPSLISRQAAEAVVGASVEYLAEECANHFVASVPEPLLLRLGARLDGMMVERDEGRPAAPDDIEEACAEILARREIQRELGTLLSPLSKEIVAQLGALAEQVDDAVDLSMYLRFWGRWRERFAKEFNLFDYLPWEALDEDGLRLVFHDLVERLAGPAEDWHVVFGVGGVDPEGYPRRVGDVTLYDGRTHDYGEWLLLGRTSEVKTPGAFARVRVSAESALAAARVGRRSLNDTLDVLTFVYSDGERLVGGFKPEIYHGVYVSQISGGRVYWPHLPGTRIPVVVRAEERDVERFGEAYRELLARARTEGFHSGEEPGEIRPGFLRAVHWYARGYWEPDPLQRFLTHWIGLEHLFVGGEKIKKAIVDEVPKLTVTWRTLEGLRSTGMTLQDLVRRAESIVPLKEKTDAEPYLVGWNSDARVLLNPAKVKVFTQLASEHDAGLARALRRHADELRGLAQNYEAITQDVEWRREKESFRLLLLNHLRNRIVHEAIPYVPYVEIYADKAEQTLRNVLKIMVADAVKLTPENEVVKDLIASYEEQPWLEARRGMPVTEESLERLREAKTSIMRGQVFEDDSANLVNEARDERSRAL